MEGRGGGQRARGRAAGWIDVHDQLTFFGKTELTGGVRRHGAQLQERSRANQ